MALENCRILVTGSDGFIGKNLVCRLSEIPSITVLPFVRGDNESSLTDLVSRCDAVVHLAGENRPTDDAAFLAVNAGLTAALCDAINQEYFKNGRHVPIVMTSSTQVEHDNPYGRSKLAGEAVMEKLAAETANPSYIFRLPGVFGKWCKPNYNSVVATFCYNIARDLPIQIIDPAKNLSLVYVDDVIDAIIIALETDNIGLTHVKVEKEHQISLNDLACQIRAFKNCRTTLASERVGKGLVRALYSTYLSYLPSDSFSYEVPQHADPRGIFVEMLKTEDSGQFSYFTANAGITRGGHYHNSKTEKFLVVKGEALFRFKNLISNESVKIYSSGSKPQIIDTIPGWTHDITNIGKDELIVLLWANEVFDPNNPDTYHHNI
jgi:UDP-2-acetamido-2,6-beta-L-arabino-hexul-4-ose reductase